MFACKIGSKEMVELLI